MLTLSVLAGPSAATAQSAGEADEGESRTAEAAEEGVVAADQELEVAQRARRGQFGPWFFQRERRAGGPPSSREIARETGSRRGFGVRGRARNAP